MSSSGGIASVSGTTAAVFLIPLLLVISIATFAVTLRCRAGRPPAGKKRSARTDSDRLRAAFTG
jgi:hypothetical protein